MKKPNITPGLWKVNLIGKEIYVESDSSFVADLQAKEAANTITALNDAKAISAVPELLEALESLLAIAKEGAVMKHETGKPTWSFIEEVKTQAKEALLAAGYTE